MELDDTRDADPFVEKLRRFDEFGPTVERLVDGVPTFTNQFWTAAQRRGNALHEISYRACFKAELPAFFVERLSAPGDMVYDPFMGRGTTLVEAALHGRCPAGNDINPLSAMLCRPRLAPPTLEEVAQRLQEVPWEAPAPVREDLLAFYHPAVLARLCALRQWLLDRAAQGPLDRASDWIRMVALSRLTGHSPGFFSVYTLPPSKAVSVASQLRINARKAQVPPERDIAEIILRKSARLLGGVAVMPCEPTLCTGPAWDSPAIADASVALVVTSPPFLDIVDYAADNWLRAWFAGIEMAGVQVSILRNAAQWQEMVRRTLAELARVVRPGGYVAFEVGEVRHAKVLLEHLVWEAASGLPFERVGVMINAVAFTKTAHIWSVANNAGGTNTNRIVLLRRAYAASVECNPVDGFT